MPVALPRPRVLPRRTEAEMTPEQYAIYAEFANREDEEGEAVADERERDGPSWDQYVREQYAEATRIGAR